MEGKKARNFEFVPAKALDNLKSLSYNWSHPAGIAQWVEHDLAKVGVEGPSPFSRSKRKRHLYGVFFRLSRKGPDPRPLGGEGPAKSAEGETHAIGTF